MSNRGGGDASLTARIQILNEGLENLQKVMQQLQQLKVEFQNTDNQMKAFDSTMKTVGSGGRSDAFAQITSSATGARNAATATHREFSVLSSTMKTTGRDTTQAAQGMMQLKSSFDQGATSTKNLSTSMQTLGQGLTSSIASYSAAAVSVFGLYNAYDNLEKVQQRADRSALAAQTAQTRLASLQENYNEQLSKGTLTAEEVAVSQSKISDAQERVQVTSQQASIAAGDLNESMAGLALQTLPFVATAAINVVHMITTMRGAFAAHTAATGVLTTATVGLRGALTGLLFHPAFLPLVAIGAVITAFTTNLFGLRDAINGIGVAIGNAIPGLRPLLDLMGGINSLFGETKQEAAKATSDVSGSFDEMETSVGSSIGKVNTTIDSLKNKLGEGFPSALTNVQNIMDTITKNLGSVTLDIKPNMDESEITKVKGEAEKVLGKGVALEIHAGATIGGTIDQVRNLGQALDDTFNKTGESNQNLISFSKEMGFSQEEASKLFAAVENVGNAIVTFDGRIGVTKGQITELSKETGVSEERITKLMESLGGFVKVEDTGLIPVKNAMVVANEASSNLGTGIDELKGQFGLAIGSFFGVISPLTELQTTMKLVEEAMKNSGMAAKDIETIMGHLNDTIATKTAESGTKVNEFFSLLGDVRITGGDVIATAGEMGLAFTDVTSRLDTARPAVQNAISVFEDLASSGQFTAEEITVAMENMRNGVATNLQGLNTEQQLAMTILTNFFHLLEGGSDLEFFDFLSTTGIPAIKGMAEELKEANITVDEFNKKVAEIEEVQLKASSTFNSTWAGIKADIQSATSVEPLDLLIEKLQQMSEIEGLPPDLKQMYEDIIEKIQIYRDNIITSDDAQKQLTDTTIAHAQQVGIGADVLGTYLEKQAESKNMTDEEVLSLQAKIATQATANGLTLSEVDAEMQRNEAYNQTILSLTEMQGKAQEQIGIQQGLEASVDILEEHYGVIWPEGLAVTAENIQMVISAQEGLVSAQQNVAAAQVEAAGGLTAMQQGELDLTNSIEDSARALGVSQSALVRYNAQKNQFGIATNQARNTLIAEGQAANVAGRNLQGMGLSMQQARAATLAGDAQFKAFARGVQVESQQSKAYANALAQALINLGMAAAKAYAMVRQSISAGEQAFRSLSGVANVKMPDMSKSKFGGGGGGGGGGGSSQSQKITKEEKEDMREQAVQDAIKEEGAVNSLVKSLIDETSAIHKLGLETGLSRKEMENYQKATNDFGIATEKARIEMLQLIEAEAKQLKFLTDGSAIYKDYIRANIEGIQKANDFTREVRSNVRSLESQREQLFQITRALGITLPSALRPTIKNLQDLINASYGSEEAMEALRKSALSATDFYRKTIADAKKAITDAKFEEFVKKELLFENLGDEFFRNVSRELQAEMKLDSISAQLQKQLGLIQLNPKMFEMNVSEAELRTGVQNTITMIEDQIKGSERLTAAWQPILDGLYAVLNAPDAHESIQSFAQMFPDLVEPAVLGVTEAMKGVDTQIETTFDDTAKENAIAYAETVENLKDKTEELYEELLKEAKAANEASGGGGGGGGMGGLGDAMGEAMGATDDMVVAMGQVKPTLSQMTSAVEVAAGMIPGEFQALPPAIRPSWETMQRDAVATFIQMGKSFDQLPPSLQKAVAQMPPEMRAALGIMENEAGAATATIADDFTILPPAAGDAGQGMVDEFGNAIPGLETETTGAVDKSKTQLATLAPEGAATGTATAEQYRDSVAAAEQYTTDTVTIMGQNFFYLVEFMMNTVNPALSQAMEIGFGALPPIVATHVTTMQTNFDVLQTGLPASTQLAVDSINLILDQLPIHMTMVVNIMEVNYVTGMQKIQLQTQTTINDITTRLGTLGPVTTGIVNEMVKQWTTGMAKFPPTAQQAVSAVTNSLGTLVQVTTNVTSRMGTAFAGFVKTATSHMASLEKAAVKNWDTMAKASEKAAQRATKAVKSIPTYHLTIHEIRTVYTGGGGSAAEGTTQIISKETHFTAGEGGRPEIVSIVPLVSDIFDKTGKKDMSLGLNADSTMVSETITRGGEGMSNPAAAVSFKSSDVTGGGGSSRTINLNINQPIYMNDREIGRNIVNQTFTDVDGQT